MLTWSGSSWTASQPFTGYQGYVNGVSCPTASFCTAAGDYLVPNGLGAWEYKPALLRWSGGSWTQPPAPAPDGVADDAWGAVSCPTASFCAATGAISYPAGYFDWSDTLLTWSGGRWTVKSSPVLPNQNGVSCSSAWHCVVVGGTPEGIPWLLSSA
jgi:hypothetical protein